MNRLIAAMAVSIWILTCAIANAQSIPYDSKAETWLSEQKSLCEDLGLRHCRLRGTHYGWARARAPMNTRASIDGWVDFCLGNRCTLECEYDKMCNLASEDHTSLCFVLCRKEHDYFKETYKKTQAYAAELQEKRKKAAELHQYYLKEEAKRKAEEKRKQEELAEQARQKKLKREQMQQTLIAHIKDSKKYSCIVACVKDKLSRELCIFDGQTPSPVPPIFIASNGEFSKNNFENSPNALLCTSICKSIGE